IRCSWLAFARRDRRGVTRSRNAFASAISRRYAARRRRRSRSMSHSDMPGQIPTRALPQRHNRVTSFRRFGVLLRGAGAEHLQRPGPAARLAPPGTVPVTERLKVLVAAVGAVERHRTGGAHRTAITAEVTRR